MAFATDGTIGTRFDKTDTVPRFALGTRVAASESTEWIYVQTDGAVTAAGYVCVIDEAFQSAMLSTSNDAEGDLVGVAAVDFADNEYGWLQVKGPTLIRVAASCAANITLNTTGTAGQLDDDGAVGAMRIDGLVLTTANGGSAATAAGMLNDAVIVGAEPGFTDGVTPGTAANNKALVLGASGEIATITSMTVTTLTPTTIAGAVAFSGAPTVTGAITPTGGVAAAGGFTARPSNIHTGGIPAQVNTDGTDVTPAITETYYAAVFIPSNMTVTGVRLLLGSATEGNAKVGLFNSAGAVVATSASTDISGATVDAYVQIAFTATYAAVGPATYYVGLLQDSTSNRFNAHAFGAFPTGKTTGETYATGFTTIASPATTFTADVGPIATLY